ncbi:hypothetical protein ILUMI_04223 [Ignelater luminosus]|uniref:Copper homeostasis protein cutC homolog n=1 Tax=Ignelater luminosus TaxID=2038154 RepID=A0A8K0GLD9_IGNLU|nr:hypothetical protein ILUMI_04223 [Ignelater luminosus]
MDEDDFGDFGEEEEGEEEEQLDPNNPDHAFILLEREFTRTVAEIEQNPQIANYADEYNKVFEALYSTNEKRRDLVDKCAELEEKVADDTEKLSIAMKLAEADAGTITALKSKIEHAWRMADSAHDREQQAQEIIDNLRNQIHALTVELDFKNKMGSDNADDAGQMSKHQEGLQREKERLMGEVAQLQQKLANALGYQEELERKNSQADLKISEIAGQLEDQASELERTKKQRDRLEGDTKELNSEILKLNHEIQVLQNTVQKSEKINNRLEKHINELKTQREKLHKDLETLSQKHTRLQDDHVVLEADHEEVTKELAKKTVEVKTKDDEAVRMRAEINKFSTIRESYDKKFTKLEAEKSTVVMDRDKIRQLYVNMEKEIEQFKKQSDLDKRTIDGMNREKDILNKNILKQQVLVKDHVKLIKIQEQSKKKLENEIDDLIGDSQKQRKQISYLEKERDRLIEEELDLTAKIEETMDDIKLKKAEIYDLKKNLAENETRLRMQQNLFEGVRAERNGLQKALQESAAECGELKNKLKVSSHQSEQLKEDIAMKEQQLIREENILRKMTKEKENLRVELDNAMEQIKLLRAQIAEMLAEEKRLHKVIMDGDRTIRQQSKDLEQLMNERDILGSQLVRRNDELALLYEKIRILQSTLHRGEAHYERRLEDIRLLKIEVKRLRQEKMLLTKSITNMTDLRQEVFHLERDLTRERLKCRALEEELQNPLNIHRWRKLEGSDPDVLELLKKVQILQKRLLQKSSEAIERERQLKETEKLYVNLRQVLARQPSPDVQNELVKTQRALTLRGNKMKCLVSELNMTEQQALEYKEDLDKVREELKQLKKKYLNEKKTQQKRLEALKAAESRETNQSLAQNSSQIKFTGGGFKMSITSSVRMPKLVEVCIDSFESAIAAINGGAGRIELCSALSEGGLTPTPGLLMQIQNANSAKIPIYCMLRCRPSNFVYSQEEIEIMVEDAKILKQHGADGFVFGALLENGDVDMKKCREIIKACFPLPVTFHRAFDFCRRPTIEVEVVIDLGFTRLLTSGQQKNAQLGVKLINQLIEQVGNRLTIVPGGGINKENLKFIADNTEAVEYHGSFRKKKTEEQSEEKDIPLGDKDGPLYVTDERLVAEIVQILRND